MDKLLISGYIGERQPELEQMLKEAGVADNFSAGMFRDYVDQNQDASELHIEIDSIGGNVREGFEIYDLILKEKAKGKKIITYGKQFSSIASVLFLSGDERKAYTGSNSFIHNSWLTPDSLGDIQLNKETLREIADSNEEADFQILSVYLQVSGRDRMREVQDLMRNESQLTDQQLLDLNFATDIISQQAPASQKALAVNPALMALMKKETYADVIGYKDGKVLLIKRSENDDFEPGTYAFPGGKIEEGEDAETTASRELREETGYTATDLELVEDYLNDDGSRSIYYTASLEGEESISEREVAELVFVTEDDIDQLKIIKGQNKRAQTLISKTQSMPTQDEKLNGIEKALRSLKAAFTGALKNMIVPLADGETELYIFSEDGEIEGKKAVIAEDGEPTENPAPAGEHQLNDGRTVTVAEGGIIESVTEPQAVKSEEMEAALAKKDEEMKALKEENEEMRSAMKDKENALQAFKKETMETIDSLKEDINAMREVVPGDDDKKKDQGVSEKYNLGGKEKTFSEMTVLERLYAQQLNNLKKN